MDCNYNLTSEREQTIVGRVYGAMIASMGQKNVRRIAHRENGKECRHNGPSDDTWESLRVMFHNLGIL